MVMKPPANLNDLILYWWKIIDREEIGIDEFQNFVAFELYTFSLEETKKKVQEAIDNKILLYDPTKETLQLSPALVDQFEQWQEKGKEKTQEMLKKLKAPWRQPIEFNETEQYAIYLSDIVDSNVAAKAATILSSKVKFAGSADGNLATGIAGTVEDYEFRIDVPEQIIYHNCPEFQQFRSHQKTFCAHLARLIMKLYTKNPQEVFKLIQNIVVNKENWEFQAKK